MATIGENEQNIVPEEIEDVHCPICSKEFHGLNNLNLHLDVDHGFDDPIENTNSNRVSNGRRKLKDSEMRALRNGKGIENETQNRRTTKNQIKRDHWKQFISKTSSCKECHRTLNKTTGAINCRKCGELFCRRHCTNIMKLDHNAKYDPQQGKRFTCCYNCFQSRPGFNDICQTVNLSDKYEAIRNKKNHDRSLRKIQLENRLVRLIDGLIVLFKNKENNIVSTWKYVLDSSALERSITPWIDDKYVKNCNICQRSFNFLMRKHHCRTCGNVVCDFDDNSCSSQVPITVLQRTAADLPFKENSLKVPNFDVSLRLCSNCVHVIYIPRKFQTDVEGSISQISSKYENLYGVSMVILNILPDFQDLLQKVENSKLHAESPLADDIIKLTKIRKRLLRSFSNYNMLTKQLLSIEPRNNAEKRIQDSIRIVSASFISEKILPLKNIEHILNPSKGSSSTIGSDGIPEIKKLSTLFNELSIKEIKEYREELMVLKEQSFLLEKMISDTKKQRKFDEVTILTTNLREIIDKMEEIEKTLGDQSF